LEDKKVKHAFNFEIKEIDTSGDGEGKFSGYASVFNNVDQHGDVVVKGAFAETIKKKNGNVPILSGHNVSEEIGMTTHLEEDDYGLYVEGRLYIDNEDPKNDVSVARQEYNKMKYRDSLDVPMKMSFGYDVLDYKYRDEDGVRVLTKLDLWEVSPVTFPANDLTEVLGVKEGRVLSSENLEVLKEALSLISAIVERAEGDDDIDIDLDDISGYDDDDDKGNDEILDNINDVVSEAEKGIYSNADKINQELQELSKNILEGE